MSYQWRKEMQCPWDKSFKKYKDWYPEYYKTKYEICKKINPGTIVEIGVRAGYSADAFLQACPTATYIGYDADNGQHGGKKGLFAKPYMEWAKKHLALYDYNVTINFPVDSQKVDTLALADFYHIDGDHSKEGVMHDLDTCYNSAELGAHLLIDDIDYIDDVKDGVYEWLEIHKDSITYEYIETKRGDILMKKIK
ncbi:MAG: class I SAM-dependent methyltransferase [Lentisphaeria bacterium]|nr:class I SAM-dependent methyltransferase [Lentisphaeria bacterium]NQZ70609.1 class I SAM-dependent methyltransferase [Lentisphaeria bacterium]